MTSSYGTSSGTKEQLSGYFDVNNEGVSIKEGTPNKSFKFWSKKKKILVIGSIVFIVLLLIIIIIAASAARKHKSKRSGVISSVSSGDGCAGDSEKQNRCKATGECFESMFVCDGLNDCTDGTDEIKSLCKEHAKAAPCNGNQFQCLVSRKCIDSQLRCNGKFDCPDPDKSDFSDERNCFTINTENSEVSVIQHGVSYKMSAKVDNSVSEIICNELGFKSLKYKEDAITKDETAKQCGSISSEFESEEDNMEEDNINDKVEIVVDCADGTLALTCEDDFCGVFGNYTGPPTPSKWVSKEQVTELTASVTPFPWVVNIYNSTNSKKRRCSGAIVDSEWIITSLDCIDDNPFIGDYEKDAWYVIAHDDGTAFSQRRTLTKVMKNHFELLGRVNTADNIVAVQVFPPFDLNRYVHQICLQYPALLPHYNCFTAGFDGTANETKHVRVVIQANQSACGEENKRHGVACFSYPHSNDPSSCIDAKGGPISCLNPATNSWTLGGIMSSNIGCDKDERLAPSMQDKANYYWATVITSIAQDYGGKCGGRAQFQNIRFQRGIREGEFYVDVSGWGQFEAWHTVYNLSSALNLIIRKLDQDQFSPKVNVIENNTGIISKNVAVLDCPKRASDMCSCKVKYMKNNFEMKEAQSLRFIDDSNQDGKVDFNDEKAETWDDENTLDNLYEDYIDAESIEKIALDDVLIKADDIKCPHVDGRLCRDNSSCIRVEFVCDGNKDCEDNSDENRELCAKYYGFKCPPRSFRCKTTYDCVPWNLRCDGTGDCKDDSDERECVRANKTLLVEQEGLSLPLSGLSPNISDDSTTSIGVSLCQAMGHGEYLKFTEIEVKDSDFRFGCYKVNTEKYDDFYDIFDDFEKYDTSECDKTYTIECGRPRCGTTGELQGPYRPSSWTDTGTIERPDTTGKDYPWVVHIKKGDRPVCSATIIQPQWVVTNLDCIDELSRDLTVEFTDESSEQPIQHKVTHKVNYFATEIGKPVKINVAMLAVDPPFNLNEISHPLCLRPPLYEPKSFCVVSGYNSDTKSVTNIRVVPRNAEECRKAGIEISSDTNDYQCVEAIPEVGDKDTCLNTKGSALQCVDGVRQLYSFAAVITQDVGRHCSDEETGRNKTLFSSVINMAPLLSWVSAIVEDVEGVQSVTCKGGVEGGVVYPLRFHKVSYSQQWYISTDKGLSVNWDSDEALGAITNNLVEYFSAAKVTGTIDKDGNNERSMNITAINSLTISSCSDEGICTCVQSANDAEAEGVMKFYIVGSDSEQGRERGYQDSDGVIFDPGNDYETDLFEPITRYEEITTEEPSESS